VFTSAHRNHPECPSEGRLTIHSVTGVPILVKMMFSGQSFTLMENCDGYYLSRHFLPSGMKEGPRRRYEVGLVSDYQLRFSDGATNERFIFSIDDKNTVQLFVNGLELLIDQTVPAINRTQSSDF
jgi:hypothetical protein